MKLMRAGIVAAFAAVLLLGSTSRTFAQTAVTNTDIQRLQDQVYDISSDLAPRASATRTPSPAAQPASGP